jgi:4-amino-4-deoxy-L-arabinose transferase-like glycosyltransferase
VTARYARRVGLVAAGALVLRVAYVLAFRWHPPLRGDEVFYSFQADALARGLGFTNPITGHAAADHPPLTALVLTPASWLTGSSVHAQRLTMAVVGTAVVAAVALAALGVALVVALAYRFLRRPATATGIAIGAAVGATALVRGELVVLLPLVVYPVAVLARQIPPRRRVVLAGIATLAAVVVIAPWALFNVARFDRLTLLSTNDGLTLVGANCRPTYHGPGLGFWAPECAPPRPAGDESVVNAAYRHDAFSYMRHHPGRLPVVVVARVGRVWGLFRPLQTAGFDVSEGRPRWASYLALAVYYCCLPLAAVGLVWAHRRRVPVLPLLGPPVAVVLIAAVFHGPLRLRVPADVTIVILAAAGLVAVGGRLGRRERQADHGTRSLACSDQAGPRREAP